MQRIALWLTLIVATSLGTWFFLSQGQNSLDPQQPVERVQPTPTHSKQNTEVSKQEIFQARERLPRIHGNSPSPLPAGVRKPVGNLIEFKVVDGYAVAYGDILLGKLDEPIPGGRGRFDAPNPQRWDHSEIPYAISKDLPNPDRVEKAITYLKEKTPISFIPYAGQKDAIFFEVGTENCLSLLGKVGGVQPIKLASGCRWQEILHEVLHALGFVHEQSRGDRDQFVEILWGNIDEKYHDQFALVPESFLEATRDFPFDYHSIMLYRPNSFALRPELLTMRSLSGEPIDPTQGGLSEIDIRKLNRMFRGYE